MWFSDFSVLFSMFQIALLDVPVKVFVPVVFYLSYCLDKRFFNGYILSNPPVAVIHYQRHLVLIEFLR